MIDDEVSAWHNSEEQNGSLSDYLGLTQEEYALAIKEGYAALQKRLQSQRHLQQFRIYQLKLDKDKPVVPFAFGGIQELRKANYEQPPASEYQLVYDSNLFCTDSETKDQILERIYQQFNDDLPEDYHGRSISPSDVIELYSNTEQRYYYCDKIGFCEVQFSPLLAKPFK